MTDYIRRADAIEAVLGLAQLNGRVPTDSVIFQIKALPSAEAEEAVLNKMLEEEMIALPQDYVKVVRCKDCKHYIVEGITTQYGWCHEYKHSVDEDDYCSYGERRKESEVAE